MDAESNSPSVPLSPVNSTLFTQG